ncbi:MAG: hypothetical protein WKF88_11135 [Ferruginibacter sp.]
MKKILLSITLVFIVGLGMANNIVVSSATLSNQNITADTEVINFSVTWDNGWRTSINESNYDGAWIFVKFRKMGTTDWRHCTINTSGFIPAAGAAFSVPTDGKGAFIYRSADGIGTVNYAGNQLVWNYGVDGILDNETVEVRVFALEMVYIPSGSFTLGTGGTEVNTFYTAPTTTAPYLVSNNNAITAGVAAGNLNAAGNMLAGTIPATFPKGFTAFWIMKYECSQQQMVDFLNHLDAARALVNLPVGITGTHPAYIAPFPERGMGSLGFNRNTALADWSGLRPYSEMEFEKASRGFNTPPVPNEYVWGNTTIIPLITVTNVGAANETVATPVNANANIVGSYSTTTPVRTGLFARTTGSDRTLSGGTYYGVMNMSDNLYDFVINSGTTQGRAILETVHGDGNLNAGGQTDIVTWQAYQAFGFRGSYFNGPLLEGRTSERTNASFFSSYPGDNNANYSGSRLARTAP